MKIGQAGALIGDAWYVWEERWEVNANKGTPMYLWPDLTWHTETNDGDEHPGLFATFAEAEEIYLQQEEAWAEEDAEIRSADEQAMVDRHNEEIAGEERMWIEDERKKNIAYRNAMKGE